MAIKVSAAQAPQVNGRLFERIQVRDLLIKGQEQVNGQVPDFYDITMTFLFYTLTEELNKIYNIQPNQVLDKVVITDFYQLAVQRVMAGDIDFLNLQVALEKVIAKVIAEQKIQYSSAQYVEEIM